MPFALLSNRLSRELGDGLIRSLLNRLAASGKVRTYGQVVALTTFTAKLTVSQQASYESVIATFAEARYHPPSVGELAGKIGISEAKAKPLLRLAVAKGQLKHLGGELFLHVEAEREMQRRVSEALQNSDGLTLSQIRQLLETSRKFAVPFCEYLDVIGLTCRQGNLRVLATKAPLEGSTDDTQTPTVDF